MQRRLFLLLAFVLATIPLASAQALPITVSFDIDIHLIHDNPDNDPFSDIFCGSPEVLTTECGRSTVVIQTTNSGIDTLDFVITPQALREIHERAPRVNVDEENVGNSDVWFAEHPKGVLYSGTTHFIADFTSLFIEARIDTEDFGRFTYIDLVEMQETPYGDVLSFFTGDSRNGSGGGVWFTIDYSTYRTQGVPEPSGLLVILGAMVIAGMARWSTKTFVRV